MRSYTNRKDEKVEVSDEHLDASIQIMDELQKASPSRRASWASHKKMMIQEGFDDSEVSESYRQMIKLERKSRGVLPSAVKTADMVTTTKIESLRGMIGEVRSAQLESRQDHLDLNRFKRNLSKDIVLIEGIERALAGKDFKTVDFAPIYNPRYSSKYMIACISDLHYGSFVEVEGFKYDTQIAERLLMEYADKLIRIAEEENVEEIHVSMLGDLIEHVSMRASNTYAAEKNLSDQITDASELLIKFILKLSQYVKVKYTGIAGNHDRINGNKNESLYGDHAVNISNKIIETFAKYSDNNVVFEAADDYHHFVSKYGKTFMFVHGDITPMKKASVLAEQSMLYGKEIDCLIGGHIHHFTMKEVGNDKHVITFGSLKGTDEYALKTIGVNSSRSQGIVLIDEDGEYEIRKIKFK